MLNVNVPCLFNVAGFHLPTLALHRCSSWSKCCPRGVPPLSEDLPLPRRDYAEDKALVPTSVTCSLAVKLTCDSLCPRSWQYCSDCTRWTPYSLGLTAPDIHRHSGARLDLLCAGPKQEQKFLCSCVFWRQVGIAVVWSLDQRNC